MKKIIIFILFLLPSACSRHQGIALNFKCKEKLPQNDKTLDVVKYSSNNMTGKLGRSLFIIRNGKIEKKVKFSKSEFTEIENYLNNTVRDIKGVFFSKQQINPAIRINDEIAPHSSCLKATINVSPAFLQTLFEKSLSSAIKENILNFDDASPIKSEVDYFRVMFCDKKFINSILKNSDSKNDEALALQYQRLNLFISYELIKAETFIFGHEICHFITDCEIGKDIELDADALGILGYHFFSSQIYYDYKKLSKCYFPDSKSMENVDSVKVMHTLIGNNLHDIVETIYSKTYFGKGNATHPSLEERLQNIKFLTDTLHPNELYLRLIQRKILKDETSESSVFERIGNGSNIIYNANWLFGR